MKIPLNVDGGGIQGYKVEWGSITLTSGDQYLKIPTKFKKIVYFMFFMPGENYENLIFDTNKNFCPVSGDSAIKQTTKGKNYGEPCLYFEPTYFSLSDGVLRINGTNASDGWYLRKYNYILIGE